MDERPGGRSNALTVDRLIARLEELERAFAALQRAYVDLQATTRARPRAPLVDELLADGPARGHAGPVPKDTGVGRAPTSVGVSA